MSLAVKIEAVDTALIAKYTGTTISVDGTPTAVEVFMEEPITEEYPERVYPSVALKLMSVLPAFELCESDDDDLEEVAYNTGVIPYERGEREKPKPHSLLYTLDTWHKARIGESRDLVSEVMITKTPYRGYIPVTNIDSQSINLDLFWDGGIAAEDEKEGDINIYHKSLSLEVLAYLTSVEYDDYVSTKVAMSLDWTFVARKFITGNNDIEIVSGGDYEDLEMRVTDTTEESI